MFRTLIYSQLLYILKSKHIQNTAEYLRWNILLRTLCNYSKFRLPIYSKLSLFRTWICQLLLIYQLILRTKNLVTKVWRRIWLLKYDLLLSFSFFQPLLSYRDLNNAPHRKYLTEFWIWFNNERKNIFILGNLMRLQINQRNEIPGNNDLFKITST